MIENAEHMRDANALNRAVFTIATGKPIYIEMAAALARSVMLWNPPEALPFYLVTDAPRSALPDDLKAVRIVSIAPGQYGTGFTPKLYLDRFAPAPRSLFIDADCLCCGPLDAAFRAFSGRAVATIGREISEGGWGGAKVAEVCKAFGVSALPRFNGGIYYLERGEACTQVYETARGLLPRYGEIGFELLRGAPNEELLVSLAMALHGQRPVAEDGTIMNSIMAGPGGIDIDVFKGRSLLSNPKGHRAHNPWYRLDALHPAILHFCGSDTSVYPYGREILRLDLVRGRGWPLWAASLWAWLTYTLPIRGSERLKSLLRPAYHALFGPRRIRRSQRV